MGSNPEQLTRLIRRAFRPDARFFLGMARLFRRPIFDFWVGEEDGHLVATTMVTYPSRSGYISTVSVNRRYRRRGFAQALIAHAHRAIRATGRTHAVLDVISDNTPARTLYDRLGYRPLKVAHVLQRDPSPADAARAPPTAPPGLRPYRRRDGKLLVPVANAILPPEVRECVPYSADAFIIPPFIASAVNVQSEAWVLERGGRPAAFVRSTVGGITRSAHLSDPIASTDVPAEDVRALVGTALNWIFRKSQVRIVAECRGFVPAGTAALEAEGFTPVIQMDTLAFDLPR